MGELLRSVTPGLRLLSSYRRSWLFKDLIAGLVLTALLVPQGMAYAELAGLPPITGLYTSILCLVGYAIFGPSKILVLGPDSSLGPRSRPPSSRSSGPTGTHSVPSRSPRCLRCWSG
jgi:MFS superfamily sulfate permease-like transporter